MSNEQLCTAALDGDTEARNALVENNLRFIKRTAYEMWSAQQELNAALGIEINDLVQEGSLGLLDCIAGYRPDTGNKFLTYAAPATLWWTTSADGIPLLKRRIWEASSAWMKLQKTKTKASMNLSLTPERKIRNRYILPKKPTKKSIPHL